MKKQMIWGSATLMLLLGIAAVFLFIDKDTETKPKMTLGQPTKDLLKKGVKLPQQAETPVAVEELPPVVPPNEHPSGPHRHEDDTVHNPSVSQTHTGPLTYHEELLKTNPVKALRLQQEERGHWSAEWIPPFPPDDTEAQEFARVRYLMEYYWHNFGDLLETPGYEKEKKELEKVLTDHAAMYGIIRSYPYGARRCDLMKLTWPMTDKDVVSDSKGNVSKHPSNYFYDPEERAILKRAGMWQE